MAKHRTKRANTDAIANQLGFVATQARPVADRPCAAGFDEIGAEILALTNSADFFAEEFDRQRDNAQPAPSTTTSAGT